MTGALPRLPVAEPQRSRRRRYRFRRRTVLVGATRVSRSLDVQRSPEGILVGEADDLREQTIHQRASCSAAFAAAVGRGPGIGEGQRRLRQRGVVARGLRRYGRGPGARSGRGSMAARWSARDWLRGTSGSGSPRRSCGRCPRARCFRMRRSRYRRSWSDKLDRQSAKGNASPGAHVDSRSRPRWFEVRRIVELAADRVLNMGDARQPNGAAMSQGSASAGWPVSGPRRFHGRSSTLPTASGWAVRLAAMRLVEPAGQAALASPQV